MIKKLSFTLLFLTCVIPVPSFADSGEDGIMCAAIHPCNADGSVIAGYETGPCAAKYIKECLGEKANHAIASCEGSRGSMVRQVRKLKKEIAKLKKQAAKSSRK